MKKAHFCIDGFSFKRINDYYRFEHKRHSRLRIASFEIFLRYEIERRFGFKCDSKNLSFEKHFYCPSRPPHSYFYRREVKDSHLKFENSLLSAGYEVHYSATQPERGPKPNEDIFMDSLLAMQREEIDFYILLSTQGDHASLLRKFRSSPITTILLGWDSSCTNSYGLKREWKTDKCLQDNAGIYCPLEKVLDSINGKPQHPMADIMFEKFSPSYPLSLRYG